MVLPLIAAGAAVSSKAWAAGAALVGFGGVALAKRDTIARDVSSIRDALRDAPARRPIPIPMSGVNIDLAEVKPWAPPLEVLEGGGAPTPPQDPLGSWRRLIEGAKDIAGKIKSGAERVAQHPIVRGANLLYQVYIYGSAVVSLAEVGRRTFSSDPNETHGPILYDYAYQPLFGDDVAVRTLLGGHQIMAAETTMGVLALEIAKRLVPGFVSRLGIDYIEKLTQASGATQKLQGFNKAVSAIQTTANATPSRLARLFSSKFEPLEAKIVTQFNKKFVAQLPSFWSVHGYSLLGNVSFIEHQMTANNTDAASVDFDRASRVAGFFGFTSIAFFATKDWLINLPRFGRVGFSEWLLLWRNKAAPSLGRALHSTDGLNWLGARLYAGIQRLPLGTQLVRAFEPHYIPRLSTVGVYAAFATVYRMAVQAVASLPILEDSAVGESLAQTNTRNIVSTLVFDPYFYLGLKSNSLRSLFGNQVIFMGLIYAINPFYSPFDGKDVAVAEADRALRDAARKGAAAVRSVALGKPLTQRNFIVPPYIDLSVETWVQLSQRYANGRKLDAGHMHHLIAATSGLLNSTNLDERRVGMALVVLLTQVSFNPAWRGLRSELQALSVVMDPTYTRHALSTDELRQFYSGITGGRVDKVPFFQFPRN